jgi:immunoglobulin I-set domain protein
MKTKNMMRTVTASACVVAGILAGSLALGAGIALPTVAGAQSCTSYGVLLAHADGSVGLATPAGSACGSPSWAGSLAGQHRVNSTVAVTATPGGGGYWLVDSAGNVTPFGNAPYYGGMGGTRLNAPIVGMASTPDGQGYWLVASDGGIFTFGDAKFHGSTGNLRLNKPVVGMAADAATGGYWLVASDGGVFAFGNAPFDGSLGGVRLNAPIRFITGTPDFAGYRMVASDGGVFNFGDAVYYGSAAGGTGRTWQALAPSPDGSGYWLFSNAGDGDGITISSYGDAASPLNVTAGDLSPSPIVSAATYFVPYQSAPPVVTANPVSQDVSAGSVATFTAAASGFPTPAVIWQVSVDQGATFQNIANATSPTLSFPTVQSESGGLFRAVFTNPSGSATTSVATLTIGDAPDVTTNPVNQSVDDGQTATFTSAATGTPAPTIQWQFSTDHGATWSSISGATTGTLSVTTTPSENGYEYRAAFTNTSGTAFSSAAILTVYVIES